MAARDLEGAGSVWSGWLTYFHPIPSIYAQLFAILHLTFAFQPNTPSTTINCTHTHMHTHSLSLSLTHTHTLSLSLSHTHTHTHTHTRTQGIGKRVLQRSGWHAGQGLGRSGEGITRPVEVEGQEPGDKKGFGCVVADTLALHRTGPPVPPRTITLAPLELLPSSCAGIMVSGYHVTRL